MSINEYFELAVIFVGLMYLLFSPGHFFKLLTPSKWVGFSASGTLCMGVAFIAAGFSLLSETNSDLFSTPIIYFIYLPFLGVGCYFEYKSGRELAVGTRGSE